MMYISVLLSRGGVACHLPYTTTDKDTTKKIIRYLKIDKNNKMEYFSPLLSSYSYFFAIKIWSVEYPTCHSCQDYE